MRQKNDGRGRLGGRAKGTPNKTTATVKEWLASLIDKNREQVEADLQALEPKDRLQMLERLMQYVVPKQQATQSDVTLKDVGTDTMSEDDIILELNRLRELREYKQTSIN